MIKKRLCGFNNLAMAMLLAVALSFIGSKSHAQTAPTPVSVTVVWSKSNAQSYQTVWYPNMTVLDAIQLAMPAREGGTFTATYYPKYYGYLINSVLGVNKSPATCLTPRNSTIFLLPLGPDRIIVGPGDTVTLTLNPNFSDGAPPCASN